MIQLKNQLLLSDIYEEVADYFQEDKPKFIKIFEKHINMKLLIPQTFYNAYYSSTGHPREYSLSSMLTALIVQKILGISETKQFINILNLSSELLSLCEFSTVPHESQFSRFKSTFLNHIHDFFNHLVDLTEPICKKLNSDLSKIIIADTTGIKAYTKENNPKFFESILNIGKTAKRSNPDINPYIFACSKTPKSTYAKDDYDSKTLIPIMRRYFSIHQDFKYNFFLGDAAYDCDDNYKYLTKDCSIVPIIPINSRNSSSLPLPSGFTDDGTPLCPKDPSLPMKFDGITREKGRAMRIKWLCPKSKKINENKTTKYILSCEAPCTTSPCGRIYHPTINKELRLNCPIPRDSNEWTRLYKIRTITERTNHILKNTLAISKLKINKTSSLKSELLLSGITQLISVIISYNMNIKNNILSLRRLVS